MFGRDKHVLPAWAVALAAVAALAGLASAGSALAAAGQPLHAEEPHPVATSWDYGSEDGLGDNTFYVSQNVQRVDAHVEPPALGPSSLAKRSAPLMVHAGLDHVEARHPVFVLLSYADDRALDGAGAPVGVEFGAEGATFQGPGAEGETMGYPSEAWYGLPAEVGYDSAEVHLSFARSTDSALAWPDAALHDACDTQVTAVRDAAPRCPERGPGALASDGLPNVVFANHLKELRAAVGSAAQRLAGEGGGAPAAAPAAPGPPGTWSRPDASEMQAALAVDQGEGLASHGGLPVPEPAGAPGARSAALASVVASSAPHPVVLLLGLGLGALAIPLYRRIVRGRVLANPMRERLLEMVRANPGIHESAVAKELGIGHTLAQYHVRMLADFGMVEVRRFGGRKCLFAAGQVGRAERTLLLAERGRGAQVMDLVAAQPGIAQRDLARALRIRESSAKWHLDRLEQHGMVVVERSSEGKRVRLSAEAEHARARAAPAASLAAPEPRPEPAGPPAPADPREPSPLHAAA